MAQKKPIWRLYPPGRTDRSLLLRPRLSTCVHQEPGQPTMFLQLRLCPTLVDIRGVQSCLQQHWLHLAGIVLHLNCFPEVQIFPGVCLSRWILSPGVPRQGPPPAKLYLLCHGNRHGIPGQIKINKNQNAAKQNLFQGLMSGIFHTCPSNLSLQFDTTMMYVIMSLVFVKIYQFR